MGMSVTHLVASERVVHQGFNQKRSSNRSSRRMFESPVITLNFIVDRLLQGKEENFQGQTDCPRPKGKIKLQVTTWTPTPYMKFSYLRLLSRRKIRCFIY
jgi:hypothetical protein